MHFHTITRIFLSALLTASTALSAAIEQRAELEIRGGSSAIQWSDSTGNHIRSYHIRTDCRIVENSHNSGTADWITNVLPFCASPRWNVVATYVRGGDNQLPEQIQLFYTENSDPWNTLSASWRADTGWRQDTQFNDLKVKAIPVTAIGFRPAPGFIGHMRLYAASAEILQVEATSLFIEYSKIYELIWIQGVGWNIGNNNGKEILWTQQDVRRGGIAAVSNDDGTVIRLYYFAESNNALPNARYVNEATWTIRDGWVSRGAPHSSLKGMHTARTLSAIRWGGEEGNPGGLQMRLYVRWEEYSTAEKYAEFEYSGGKWQGRKDLPSYVLDRLTQGKSSAIAWTYPSWDQVHIRLYNPRTDINKKNPYVHEIAFDTGVGWKDASNLPA